MSGYRSEDEMEKSARICIHELQERRLMIDKAIEALRDIYGIHEDRHAGGTAIEEREQITGGGNAMTDSDIVARLTSPGTPSPA